MPTAGSPEPPAGVYARAFALHQKGQLFAAEELYSSLLQTRPNDAAALHMLGMVLVQRGETHAGIERIRLSIALDPGQPAAHSTLGNALRNLGRPLEALEQYDRALELDPRHAPALNNRGSALLDLGRTQEAADSYERSLRFKCNNVGALLNYGTALTQLGRSKEALACYERVLELKPNFAPALLALATALRGLRRFDDALRVMDRYLTLLPENAQAHHDRGMVLHDLHRLEEAVQSFDRAIELERTCSAAHFNRAISLSELQNFDAAAASYARVLEIEPHFPFAAGGLLQAKMMMCDWADWSAGRDRLVADARDGRATIIPFALLAIAESAADQSQSIRAYARDIFPPAAAPLWAGQRYPHDRIRVGYLSADFKEHPVSIVLAGVLERHDRKRFEIIAASLGPPDTGPYGKRIQAAADRYQDLSRMNDAEAADLLRRLEVDVLVDLQGFTQGTRAGILARRCAPIQVNFLGFPATMGASYIDYIIGDGIVIPPGVEHLYAERIVRLPHCYLPFDNGQRIASHTPSRAAEGLPADGFVFCAFNNHYKIVPPVFDIWMRLLAATPRSCLWLRAGSPEVMINLRREAGARGIDADRLVFAPRVGPLDQHLARQRHADLFLDTLPYGAHATAAVALWAGVPVVTCLGDAFAGRVAASLLHDLELPQLVAQDFADYERLALELAHDSRQLHAARAALAHRRSTAPVFDTDRYRRALESAFAEMYGRQRRGEAPADIEVPDLG